MITQSSLVNAENLKREWVSINPKHIDKYDLDLYDLNTSEKHFALSLKDIYHDIQYSEYIAGESAQGIAKTVICHVLQKGYMRDIAVLHMVFSAHGLTIEQLHRIEMRLDKVTAELEKEINLNYQTGVAHNEI